MAQPFPCLRGAIVAAAAGAADVGMIDIGWLPRKRAVTVAALRGGDNVCVGFACCNRAVMTR